MMDAYGVQFNPNTDTLKTTSPIKSLGEGRVTLKNIIKGQIVSPNEVLYEVTDLSTLFKTWKTGSNYTAVD